MLHLKQWKASKFLKINFKSKPKQLKLARKTSTSAAGTRVTVTVCLNIVIAM